MRHHPDISRFLLAPDEEEDDTVMAPIEGGGHWDETQLPPPPIATPTPRPRTIRDTPTVAVRLPTAAPARPPPAPKTPTPSLPVVSFVSGFWAIAGFMLGAWWAS